MNALAILIALRFERHAVRPLRVAAGAMAGVLISGVGTAVLPGDGARMALWLPAAMAVMRIADGDAHGRMLSSALLLLAACGLLGGTVHALAGATGSLTAAWLIGAGFALASAVYAGRRRATPQKGRVLLEAGGRAAEFEAIIDSGNTLTDYLTRLPVVVLAQEDALALLDAQALRLRPLFADTAGGRQMMWCFLPERMMLRTAEGTREIRAAAALSPGLHAGSPALIPGALAGE